MSEALTEEAVLAHLRGNARWEPPLLVHAGNTSTTHVDATWRRHLRVAAQQQAAALAATDVGDSPASATLRSVHGCGATARGGFAVRVLDMARLEHALPADEAFSVVDVRLAMHKPLPYLCASVSSSERV